MKKKTKVKRHWEWIKTPCAITVTAPANNRIGRERINRRVLKLELNEHNKVLIEWLD